MSYIIVKVIDSNYMCMYSVTPTQVSFIVQCCAKSWHDHLPSICSHDPLLLKNTSSAAGLWVMIGGFAESFGGVKIRLKKQNKKENEHLPNHGVNKQDQPESTRVKQDCHQILGRGPTLNILGSRTLSLV